MLLRTDLLPNIPPPADDADVLLALASAPVGARHSAAAFRVCFENDAGAVYRTASIYGLASYASVLKSMRALGYSDVRQCTNFDVVFSRRQQPSPAFVRTS
jgi:hypothetical protein